MRWQLVRDLFLPDATVGVLMIGLETFQTIERPWLPSDSCRGGQSKVSCVPPGLYKLVRHDSPKHPKTWALSNLELDVCHNPTPGKRSDVLIHPANYAHELEGCIAPGEARLLSAGEWCVLRSRLAFQHIQDMVPWTDDHELLITNKGDIHV